MKTTRKISALRRCRNRLAFTMVESLLMVSMLGMSAAVVGQSLSTMATSATNNNNLLQINDALMAQMEYLRSKYHDQHDL
jgi:type II secretory pathway pseudopilin PulG